MLPATFRFRFHNATNVALTSHVRSSPVFLFRIRSIGNHSLRECWHIIDTRSHEKQVDVTEWKWVISYDYFLSLRKSKEAKNGLSY